MKNLLRRSSKKGFTLVEMLLVLGVIMLLVLMKVRDLQQESIDYTAKVLSQQVKKVSDATNAYIVLKYSEISALSSSGITCDKGSATCTIPLSVLKSNYLLPSSFSEKTILRQGYQIQVKRSGASPNYMISGLVITNTKQGNRDVIYRQVLGRAVRNLGIDGGSNSKSGIMSGNGGGWQVSSSDFSILSGKTNYLGDAVGSLSGAYYVYLRRDGTLPMTGNLNMGAKDITNSHNINASNNIVAGNNITAGHELIGHNGYGDEIALGGDSIANDYELRLSSGKTLVVHSPKSGSYTTVLSIERNVQVQQRLGLMGRDPNDIPSNWTGGLRTLDVYADGTVGVGKNKQLAAYMNSSGYIYASGNIETNSNITANGQITAKGQVKGATLKPTDVHVIGDNCSDASAISRTTVGIILYCYEGRWQSVGDLPGTIKLWAGSTPPQDWLELNGQSFNKSSNPVLAGIFPSGRLSDTRGYFIRGWDHGRGLDPDSNRGNQSVQEDAIRNITGSVALNLGGHPSRINHSGAYSVGRTVGGEAGKPGGNTDDLLNFDASLVVPTASENRPKNMAFMYIIKKG